MNKENQTAASRWVIGRGNIRSLSGSEMKLFSNLGGYRFWDF